jgi:hypothetical protein
VTPLTVLCVAQSIGWPAIQPVALISFAKQWASALANFIGVS